MLFAGRKTLTLEILVALALFSGLSYLFLTFDVFDRWYFFTRAHESWELDELTVVFLSALFAMVYFFFRIQLIKKAVPQQKEAAQVTVKKPAKAARRKLQQPEILSLSLTAIYVLGLSLIAFTLFLSYMVIDNALSRQVDDATMINVAGRQRMYTQRAALMTFLLTIPEKRAWAEQELRRVIMDQQTGSNAILYGDEELGLQGITAEEWAIMWREDSARYNRIQEIKKESSEFYGMIITAMGLDQIELSPEHPLILKIIDRQNHLLRGLDEAVNQYEIRSRAEVMAIQRMEQVIIISALILLVLEGMFIFQPMVRRIRRKTGELLEANKELKQRRHKDKISALGEMASGLAHEINNSLQPVLGLSEIAMRRLAGKDEQLAQHMDTIRTSALHAKTIVENVLEFSRKGEGIDFENHEAGKVLQEALTFAKSLLPSSVQVVYADPKAFHNIPGIIRCSKTNLIQIFINIIKNAVEAMNEKGTITLGVVPRAITAQECGKLDLAPGNYITVSLSDTGPGMDQATVENIFNPFFTTKGEGEGTGLGLSTVYGIMKQHGGAVTVKSKIGKGTTFTLFFPVASESGKAQAVA